MNDENVADSTVGEDSDSTKAYKSGGIIPPAKEKKKPFFKKVIFVILITSFPH